MKITKTQIDYLTRRLNVIIENKLQQRRNSTDIDSVYEWIKANPIVLRKREDIKSVSFSTVSSFFDTNALEEFKTGVYKVTEEYRKSLQKYRDTILDNAVLGDEDITKMIKVLEDM